MAEPQVSQSGGRRYGFLDGGHVKVAVEGAAPSANVRLNPYADVNWGAVAVHPGITHMHPDPSAQAAMDVAYAGGGRFIAWGRYYPEQPMTAADFTSVPSDVVLINNSEQHSCTDSKLHFCPIGSTYANNGGTLVPWRDAFDAALALLTDPLGGGITINHPIWSSSVKEPTIHDMLDHDPRVLGIEAYNHGVATAIPPTYRSQPAYPLWDRILATGRRCWGFWAWDHYIPAQAPYKGFNMLLLTDPTAAAACRAYRQGQFYGSMTQQVRLTGVSVSGRFVTISTDVATELRMVSDGGLDTKAGPSATFLVPEGSLYARFEAESALDTIYTQPILY